MAAGNQEEKGTCADLVKDTSNSKYQYQDKPLLLESVEPPKKASKQTSPIRFERAVSRPPPSEARERKKMTKKKEVKPSKSQATNRQSRSPAKTSQNIEPRKNRTVQ